MNKKHIKSLSLFLILLFIIITIATVSATDTNQTTDDTSQNAVTENIINDRIYEDNNNDKNIIETSEITTKNIQKNNNQTESSKQSSNEIQSEITVGSTKTAYVGDKISVYGKLSAQGKAIPNATVFLYVGSDKYKITTSQYGNYNHKITIDTDGIKTIRAVFYATGNFLGSEAKTTVTVNQRMSEITVGSKNTIFVGDKINIYGKLSSDNKAIANAIIRVYVDGTQYNVVTSQYGNYNIKVPVTSEGSKKITANYPGSNVYTESEEVIYFQANQRESDITVGSTKTVYVGDKVNIYGKLTSNNVAIANVPVKLNVDGTQYSTVTSKYGNYNLKVTVTSMGNKKITSYYSGSNIYETSEEVIYFQAEKRLTDITLGSTKNSYVDDEISIYGRLTSKGYSLPNREININIDGTTHKVTTNTYGDYKLKTKVTEEGTGNIKVTYTGNYMYNEATNNIKYTVNKKNNITIGCAKEVLVGEKLKIYGKLTTRGKGAAYKQITITVEGSDYTTTTSKYGNYNIIITPTTEGENTIEATYADTPSYNTVTTDTTFQANKKDTTITVGTAKTGYVNDKLSVYGKLTSKGYALSYKQVKITANGKTYTVTTSKYGNYNTNITITSTGYKTITATYEGSNVYHTTTNTTSTQINKKVTEITVGCTKTITVGNPVSIYGKLSANGKGVAYKQISIKIDNTYHHVTTNKYGDYNLKLTDLELGTSVVTAYYYGDEAYTESNALTTYGIVEPSGVMVLNLGTLINGNYPPYYRYYGNDEFSAWYQTYDAQHGKGVHLQVQDTLAEDMGWPPNNLITDATFFFINDDDEIISSPYEIGYGDYMYHSLIDDYTPYKVVFKYRKMTQNEKNMWNNGYGFNPRTGKWTREVYY